MNATEAVMHIGDAVRLRPEAARGRRRELAGEVGQVGDVWRDAEGERCAVVYEAWQQILWDVAADDFEPAAAAEMVN